MNDCFNSFQQLSYWSADAAMCRTTNHLIPAVTDTLTDKQTKKTKLQQERPCKAHTHTPLRNKASKRI
jgi:hypothetical protein